MKANQFRVIWLNYKQANENTEKLLRKNWVNKLSRFISDMESVPGSLLMK